MRTVTLSEADTPDKTTHAVRGSLLRSMSTASDLVQPSAGTP